MKKCFLACVLIASCVSPQKGDIVDLLTPDSLGVGAAKGTLDGLGLGNKTMRNQQEGLELDFEGESKSTSVWLEWNLPSFPDNESLNKDNRRDRYMVAINEKVDDLQELTTYQMERDVEISTSHAGLVDSFLIDSDRKEQQLQLVSIKLNEVHNTLEGLENLIIYNTERLGELEDSILVAQPLEPSEIEVAVISEVIEDVIPTEAVKEFTPINLDEPGRPLWLWALFLIGLAVNVYIVYRILTSKEEEEVTYIPASEVSGSLAWLREDLLHKDNK